MGKCQTVLEFALRIIDGNEPVRAISRFLLAIGVIGDADRIELRFADGIALDGLRGRGLLK